MFFRGTVKDGRGNPIPYTKHGKEVWGPGVFGWNGSAGNYVWEMEPGGKVTLALILSRIFDLSKSGVYVIQIRRPNLEDTRYPATESNTITVAVTD